MPKESTPAVLRNNNDGAKNAFAIAVVSSRNLSAINVHHYRREQRSKHMAQQRSEVKADRLNPAVAWTAAFTQAAGSVFAKTGAWAVTTAQKSATVLAVLMGPAVLSIYAFAFWSLTSEMGWTDSFPFSSGPLSSWIIWIALAAAMHSAAVILSKQKDRF